MQLPNPQEIRTFQNKIALDPVFFVENVLGHTLWQKQKEILESVRDNPETSVRSCHASGKTFTAADVVHWWLLAHPDSVVITTAPTFRQVKEVLWREIGAGAVGRGLYPKGAVLDTKINISDKWYALGLSSDVAEQFQGFHSPHLLIIGDEASGIPEVIFQAMDGLTPERILLISQPSQNTGRFAETFKRPHVHKITISAFDTPNVQEGRQVIPGLITKQDVERIRTYYGEDSDVYRVRVLGEFPKADVDTLISVDEVAKAMDRESKVLPQFEKKMGVDVARFGDDRTVIVVRQMEAVIRKEVYSGIDTMQTVGHVLRIAKEMVIKPGNISIDVIGVGAGVVDRLKEQGWQVNAVNVGESPKDKEHFKNLRAELYAGAVKEWIKTASLPKDDDFYELANIKYKFDSSSRLQMESKEDMKKRSLPSPDVADALMLTFASTMTFYQPMATKPIEGYYPEIGL